MRQASVVGGGMTCRLGLVAAMLLSTALSAQESRFPAVVVTDDVPIRAGAGTSYYVVGHLKQGTVVSVDDRIFEWYKIVPPAGVHSFVSKGFVDSRGDGTWGVVNKDRARILAASIDGPGTSYRRQLDLLKDARVQITGEEGGFYKIVPPDGAFVFVPVKALERTQFTPAVAEPTPVASQEWAPAVVEPVPTVRIEPTPAPRVDPTPMVISRPGSEPEVQVMPLPPIPSSDPVTVTLAEPSHSPAVVVSPVDSTGGSSSMTTTWEPRPEPTARFDRAPVVSDGSLPVVTSFAEGVSQATVDATRTANERPHDDRVRLIDEPGLFRPDPSTVAVEPVRVTPPPPVWVPDVPIRQPVTEVPVSRAPVAEPVFQVERPAAPIAAAPTLQALETRFSAAQGEPLDRRPIDQLLSSYETLGRMSDVSAADQRIIAARVAQLRRDRQLAAAVRQISNVQEQVNLGAPPPAAMPSGTNKGYDAIGYLTASAVYDGQNLPRLFRLTNPVDQQTIVYVRPSAALQPNRHIGRVIGVFGTIAYDPSLRLKILTAERLDVIESVSAE